jgi:hypothetical protein
MNARQRMMTEGMQCAHANTGPSPAFDGLEGLVALPISRPPSHFAGVQISRYELRRFHSPRDPERGVDQ